MLNNHLIQLEDRAFNKEEKKIQTTFYPPTIYSLLRLSAIISYNYHSLRIYFS